jgi:methionine sulfoxide reductase heme-binding subunit
MTVDTSGRLRAPLGAGPNRRRRLLMHHLPLGLASAGGLGLFMGLTFVSGGHGNRALLSRLTVATGYVGLGLLAVTLLIGPANLLLGRRNPVSNYLRRDVGTWTACASAVHVVLGFQVRSDGGVLSFVDYFVADGRPLTSDFGLGNWTGLGALVIVLGLLAISTNRTLQELRGRRWKRLQRLNYGLFALVVLHAVLYGALHRLRSPFTMFLLAIVTAVFVAQAVGIWLWRRRHARLTLSSR